MKTTKEQAEIKKYYTSRIQDLSHIAIALRKKSSGFALLRTIIVLGTAGIIIYFWTTSLKESLISLAIGTAAFLAAISMDGKNREKLRNTKKLIEINENELKHLDGDDSAQADGKEYLPTDHDYATDLDLFGPRSLYPFISRACSEQGKKRLANRLLNPLNAKEIKERQQAYKELSQLTDWYQQWQAIGMKKPVDGKTEQSFRQWIQQSGNPLTGSIYRVLVWLFPIITISSIVIYFLDSRYESVFYITICMAFIISSTFSYKLNHAYAALSAALPQIRTLQKLLTHLDSATFVSPYLNKIQRGDEKEPSAKALRDLENIMNKMDLRLNIFAFALLNTLLLWDVRMGLKLKEWKDKYASQFITYFEKIAEIDVAISFAILWKNHPTWTFAEIQENEFKFSATGLGHPLIAENNRKNNDFSMEGLGKISIITGSNMGGKSTFLRSLGLSIILTEAGAPVPASKITLSPFQLRSSMRIVDNIQENTSTFYAELKKLERILKAVREKEKCFILMDEILRGTNSLDKHAGSEALIRQLLKEKAVAVLATHDAELTEMAKEFPQEIFNYHFDVRIEGEELFFDYLLKPGPCKQLNAKALMRKIGIEM